MMIYVHVPFCRSKCRYCAFYSEVADADDTLSPVFYLATLQTELMQTIARLRAQFPADALPEVSSVFFGGGTPSLLDAAALANFLISLRQIFPFAPDAEITLEGNPESLILPDKLKILAAAGFNRLSMGVQSMDSSDLALLGRTHHPEDVVCATALAREAGFNNINLDLIWGLPGQTPENWLRQLERVLALHPEHISTYGLTLEENTPLAKDVHSGLALPDDTMLAQMYLDGSEYLENHGMQQYEISNFAMPGFVCRHNLGYWQGKDYIGFGPAAVSTLNGMRRNNPENLAHWAECVLHGLPAETETLDLHIRIEELIMLRLRTCDGLELHEYSELTGRNFLAEHAGFVQDLLRNGLAVHADGILRLTRQGMLVSNSILTHFIEVD